MINRFLQKYKSSHTLLIVAVVIAFLLHGSSFIFTFPKTYDAYVHLFFADHYAKHWFEPWENRWYTGFSVTSYPPLLHQIVALISFLIGLKAALVVVTISAIIFLIIGVYRFSQLWVSEKSAAYAACVAVVCPSLVEAIHVFGQIPTTIGISFLLNALPDVYLWIKTGKKFHFFAALSLLLVVASAHHVTIIFGQVFFVAPVVALAIFDRCEIGKIIWNRETAFIIYKEIKACFWRVVPFFVILLVGIIVVIFPYWYLSKTDPIAQVSIPHGSRDNFLIERASGTMFFAALWGVLLPFLFFALRRSLQHRNLILFIPLILLFVLGTGGTTPIPQIILGKNAFNILTLDRFSFWATILTIPFAGEFLNHLFHGEWGEKIVTQYGKWAKNLLIGYIVFFFIIETILLLNLGNWNITQPQSIDIKPITSFLSRDEHFRWRYLTLGFGDQMAWLSANTDAQCIDGNYHSARRLPELTSRAIERLENAKFKGIEGIGSLQQFLTIPEKYNLKYIFSNDKFYDPMLYYAGWHRVQRLENGIMVWEKQDIPKLKPQAPALELPKYQKIMWGVLPLSTLIFALFTLFFRKIWVKNQLFVDVNVGSPLFYSGLNQFSDRFWNFQNICMFVVPFLLSLFVLFDWLVAFFQKNDPQKIVEQYYDRIDKKYFADAYTLFKDSKNLSLEQYQLEISVEDGLLLSFAQLDEIKTQLVEQTDSTALVNASVTWVTPLESYERTYSHFLQKVKGKWKLKPKDFDLSIPADEAFRRTNVQFKNQGKRRVSTQASNLEDVLDRPEMNIADARLVKKEDLYSVVGQVMNIDNYPSHVTITAVLFDAYGDKIIEYNAQHFTHHKILPKETTPFRIDIDPFLLKGKTSPTSVKIFVQSVSEEKSIYKNADIQSLMLNENNSISGKVINSGTEEITIPQVIATYYNRENQVIWVDKMFLPYGVRPERQCDFTMQLCDISQSIETIYIAQDQDKIVNGLENATFLTFEARNATSLPDGAKLMLTNGFALQVSVNAFLSSPTW